MGYFLIRESMLDSVIVARDKFLKPGGALYPSHARLFLAPIQSQITRARLEEFYVMYIIISNVITGMPNKLNNK